MGMAFFSSGTQASNTPNCGTTAPNIQCALPVLEPTGPIAGEGRFYMPIVSGLEAQDGIPRGLLRFSRYKGDPYSLSPEDWESVVIIFEKGMVETYRDSRNSPKWYEFLPSTLQEIDFDNTRPRLEATLKQYADVRTSYYLYSGSEVVRPVATPQLGAPQ